MNNWLLHPYFTGRGCQWWSLTKAGGCRRQTVESDEAASVEEKHVVSPRGLYPFISVRTWFVFERAVVLILDLQHDLADILWCFSLPRCRGVFHDQIYIYSASPIISSLLRNPKCLNMCLNMTLNGSEPCVYELLIYKYPFDILARRSKFCIR